MKLTNTPITKGKCPFHQGKGPVVNPGGENPTEKTVSDGLSLSGAESKCPSSHTLAGVALDSAASAALGTLPGVSKAGCPKCS